MAPDGEALLSVLRDPQRALAFDAAGWNGLLECARRHSLHGKLCLIFEDAGLFTRLPGVVREILTDAKLSAEANQNNLRYEANRVMQAMRGLDLPVVLLKGGAYLMAGLPAARGRVSGDLDILVPRARIDEVEQAMIAHGWESLVTDSYDEQYYRQWSHQVPPLRHAERDSELDLHHTIAPPTGPAQPDTESILAESRPLPDERYGNTPLRVLCPADMVLHSAVHLFNEQMSMALRDLSDMHDLITHFAGDEGFWTALTQRATRHRVERPLFYCTRYCRRYLGTAITPAAAREIAAFGPDAITRAIMDRLVEAALIHAPHDRREPHAELARWLLFVRSHWLRMPLGMLIRHLAVKAFRRSRPHPDEDSIAQA